MLRDKSVGSGKKILVIEDHAVSRKLAENILQKQAYTVITASGGKKGLQKFKSEKPDLILLDVMMPDLDGITVCKKIHAEIIKPPPVIFLTASTDSVTLKEAFDAGGKDYIQKPLNKTELTRRIQAVFDQIQLNEKEKEHENLKSVVAMATSICHEINQPLQYISGMSQLLMQEFEEGSYYHKTVKKMYDQVEKIDQMTKKLMSLEKVETKEYINHTRMIDLGF